MSKSRINKNNFFNINFFKASGENNILLNSNSYITCQEYKKSMIVYFFAETENTSEVKISIDSLPYKEALKKNGEPFKGGEFKENSPQAFIFNGENFVWLSLDEQDIYVKLDEKAEKTVTDELKYKVSVLEEEVSKISDSSITGEEFGFLEAKVSAVEGVGSDLTYDKVDRVELESYFDKEATIQTIYDEVSKILEASPELSESLVALVKMVKDDPDFANNIAFEVSKKADKSEMDMLQTQIVKNQEEIVNVKNQKFITVTQEGHDFLLNPVFYTPLGWVKVDTSQNQIAEAIAVKKDENTFFVVFDGVVNIQREFVDEVGDELSNGHYYHLSNDTPGALTKELQENGIQQTLLKVVLENGNKKAVIMLDSPFMI